MFLLTINHLLKKYPGYGQHCHHRAKLEHVGPAIVLTGAILFGGYAFMALGSLKTVQLFGLLTAVSIIEAMYGERVISPLLLARFDAEPEE